MAKERAASLTAECAAAKAILQEQEDRLCAKEMECKVLRLNLVKESDHCEELERACSSLRVTNENVQKMTVDLCGRLEKSKEAYEAIVQRAERLITAAGKQEQMHADELAKAEEQRAKEARIAEDLRGQIAAAKTGEEELCTKIAELANDHDKE